MMMGKIVKHLYENVEVKEAKVKLGRITFREYWKTFVGILLVILALALGLLLAKLATFFS